MKCINELIQDVKTTFHENKQTLPIIGPEVKKIGTLNVDNESIMFVVDYLWIYANGEAIIPTYNDWHTASETFKQAMKMGFPNNFSEIKS